MVIASACIMPPSYGVDKASGIQGLDHSSETKLGSAVSRLPPTFIVDDLRTVSCNYAPYH